MLSTSMKLVDLSGPAKTGVALRPFMRVLEQVLGLDQVNDTYDRFGRRGLAAEEFCYRVLEDLKLDWTIEGPGAGSLAAIKGPCLVVANHPMGGREALLMMVLLSLARRDFKVMANHILGAIPELQERLLLVDPFGQKSSAGRNLAPLRQARHWLEQGGMLGIFPAGEVSFWQSEEGRIADCPWSPQVIRLAAASNATIVPVHFSGQLSTWLQVLADIYPTLKTPFLAREMMCARPEALRATVGRPIPGEQWQFWGRPHEVATRLRDQVYGLAAKKG